jgi:alpha-glucoside transport system permease protein
MSTTTPPLVATPNQSSRALKAAMRADAAKTKLSSPWASGLAILIAILWTIPTFGMVVNSVRTVPGPTSSGWWTFFSTYPFTFKNYTNAWTGNGTGAPLSAFVLNTFVITIPAVILPITLALIAAYAFAWIDFKGRSLLFVAVFAMQIVPIQVALIPLNTTYVAWGLGKSFWPIWFSHTIFGLPLAIFLLHNFMKEIPASIVEAARVDGAGHVKIFFQVLLPLLIPAIAAFGIFQFLWVWNDLLVALVFAPSPNLRPITAAIADLAGSRGGQWQLLSAGAFIAVVVPLVVFLSLQRYFVRGLLAGGVKG